MTHIWRLSEFCPWTRPARFCPVRLENGDALKPEGSVAAGFHGIPYEPDQAEQEEFSDTTVCSNATRPSAAAAASLVRNVTASASGARGCYYATSASAMPSGPRVYTAAQCWRSLNASACAASARDWLSGGAFPALPRGTGSTPSLPTLILAGQEVFSEKVDTSRVQTFDAANVSSPTRRSNRRFQGGAVDCNRFSRQKQVFSFI